MKDLIEGKHLGMETFGRGKQLMDDVQEFTHESYGLVQFTRMSSSGHSNLFGSALNKHYSMITLQISRAILGRTLHRDWYHGRGELIEVTLSAAQFAELLTTMNCGSGVPCTINHVGGKRMEAPPPLNGQPEQIRNEFVQDQVKFAEEVSKRGESIMAAVKTLSKKKQDEIQLQLDMIVQHIDSNMPFAMTSFEEATEKVLTSAKAEAEAFVTHAVQVAGLKSIKQLGQATEQKLLDEEND